MLARAISPDALTGPVEERVRLARERLISWLVTPALQMPSVEAAVQHVLDGRENVRQAWEELQSPPLSVAEQAEAIERMSSILPPNASPALYEATGLFQRAQRLLLRAEHANPHFRQAAGLPALYIVRSLGAPTGDLLFVARHAAQADSPLATGLAATAAIWATDYLARVRALLDALAPQLDAADPFRKRTLDELLARPPHDGPTVPVGELGGEDAP